MITTWRQRGMAIVAMLTGLIIMVGVVFGSANTAYAATLTPADERYHVAFPYNDMEYYVGVAGLDASGNKYYCIEAGKLSDYVIGPTTVLASDENARRMAWILDRYRDTDAATHAAIGIIVQDHFGRDRDEWARQMAVIQGRYPRDRGEGGPDMGSIGRQDACGHDGGTHRCRGFAQRFHLGESGEPRR